MPVRVLGRPTPITAIALVIAACTSELPVPEGIKLTCEDGRCPAGYTCIDTRAPAVCVPSSSVGSVPDVVTFSVAPPVARVGVEVRVTFTVSKPLGKDPTVALDLTPPRQLTKDAGASAGNTYVYTYDPTGEEPHAQDLLVKADLEDVQGLTSTGETVGLVRFDFTTPALAGAAITGSPARGGGTVRLAFTASEPLSQDPVARVGGAPMTKDATSAGLSYVFTYVSSGTESEDPAGLPVAVDLVDLGGNAATGIVTGPAVFDRTPPALAGAAALSPAAASVGTLVRATFTANEDLGTDPVVKLGAIVLDKGAQAGRAYTYSHVTSAGDPEGPKDVTFDLRDLAGNVATVTEPGGVRLDFGPPGVTALALCDDDGTAAPCAAQQTTFSAQAGHDAMKISFALSEPAAVEVSIGTAPLAAPDGCTSSGLAFVCRHRVVDPGAGAQPRVETAGVYVQATDPAGNRALVNTFMTRDFDPPGLAGTPFFERCDAYPPARVAANDLWTKPVAGYGCEFRVSAGKGPVRVSFTLDEPVPFTPYASGVLRVHADDGTSLWLDPATTSPTQFVAVLPGMPAEGTRTLRADVRDPVGNTATVDLGTLRVDLTPPAAPDAVTAGRVVYQRYPWGADVTRGAKAFYLRGSSGAAAPGNAVVAYDGSDRVTAAEIGRTTADLLGGFGGPPGSVVAFPISSGNVPEVFVAQEDLAGNSSAPALVWGAEWTATPGFKVAGDTSVNPSVLAFDPAWRDSRYASSQAEPPNPSALGRRNAGLLSTSGAPDLRDATPTAAVPPARARCGMAHDADVGRTVLFGGYYDFAANSIFVRIPLGDTWAWDGRRWKELDTTGSPPPDALPALVHDPVRGRTVLVTSALETWELARQTWRRVCWPGCAPGIQCSCTRSPTTNRAAFWDPVDARVVVDGAWAWNGGEWTTLAPAQPLPAGLAQAAARPDIASALALVAACSSCPPTGTFTWNGSTWAGPGGAPLPGGALLSDLALWWDPGQGAFLAWDRFSGSLSRWNGSAWTALPSPASNVSGGVPQSERGCGAWDGENGGYLVFGGCENGGCNDRDGGPLAFTYRLDSTSARLFTPGVSPAPRRGPAMTDVRDESRAWLFQGLGASDYPYKDDWSWDGVRWTSTSPNGTSFDGLYGGALSWLGPGRLAQHGGLPFGPGSGPPGPGAYVTQTRGTAAASAWTFFGGDPSFYAQPTSPRVEDSTMTWDTARSQVVYFRGSGTPTWTGLWSDSNPGWAGSGATSGLLWTPKPSPTAPGSVKGHRLASCEGAGGVVLFGGETVGGALLDETWLWNGTAWTQLSPAGRPAARRSHAMFCDERREKVLLAGGAGAAGPLDDLWEFDGTSWREVFPSERPEARREAGGAFVSGRGEGVLFGGLGTGFQGDTWVSDGGRDRRPAHLFHAAFAAAATGPVTIDTMAVSWVADASSSSPDFPSLPSYLAELYVRDGARWRLAGGGNINPDRLIAWSTTADPAWTSLTPAVRAARLRNLLAGDRLDLSLAVTPHGTNGTLSPGATLTSGYVEARVSYRLSCLTAGAATTTPLRCCSSTAFGNVCQ